MKIINLYGHLIIDKMFLDFEYVETIGGIANVWYGLLKLNENYSVKLKPCSIGEAIISINKITSERFSRSVISKNITKTIITPADWHHIAYINQIKNMNFYRKLYVKN
jgi:hypothetical protein